MSYQTLKVTQDARGVATLTLAREEKHNALSGRMIDELTIAAKKLGEDASVRVVVITGDGQSFCAGGDLEWMREQFSATREIRMTEARKLAMMLNTLNETPKPLIAKVQGQAFGGGVGLMCVCDVVVAAEGLKFGLTETRLGLIPATISPYVIARMGEGRARRVFMSARIFDTNEAVDLGIVSRMTPRESLEGEVEKEIKPYLSAAPGAVAASKALARSLGPKIDAEVIDDTITRLADTWEQAEAQEGVSAFFEKRKPNWLTR